MGTMLRQSQLVVEALVANTAKLRPTQHVVEAFVKNDPTLRLYQLAIESVTRRTDTTLQLYQLVVEAVYTEVAGTVYELTLTVACTADFVIRPGTGWPQTLTVAGFAAFTPLSGATYVNTATIDGISSISVLSAYGIVASVTVAGIADITLAPGFGPSFTIGCIADCLRQLNFSYQQTLIVAAITAISSPGGLVHELNRAIEGFSDIIRLPGWGYFNDLTVDGVCDTSQVEQYIKNFVLSVDGVSDCTTDSQYGVNATLTVVGVASFAYVDTVDCVQFLTVPGSASINVENIYNILYDVNVICQFTTQGAAFKNTNELASSIGSFTASCSGVFNRAVAQGLIFVQFVTYKKPTGIANQAFIMSQTVTFTRLHNETVTQTFTMTQDATAARGLIQSIVFVQSATCVKVIARTVSQTFLMTDLVTRTTVMNRTLSDTLVFNIVQQQAAPIIGSQGGGDQTQFHYNQPLINVVLKPRNCLVILGSPTQTVILPCPIFGDTQSYTGELNLKKTMTGETYTYVKKTSTERLKYTFDIGTYKSIELRNFLLNHSHELITMYNWKGETWYVFVVNNPFDFTHEGRWQPKGERVTITLEFEGIRRQ